MKRMYGFFACKCCGRKWESAHVPVTILGIVLMGQKCRKCDTTAFPYKVEKLMNWVDDDDDEESSLEEYFDEDEDDW